MSKTYIVYLPERYIEKRPDGEEWLQMPINVSGHELMIKTVIPLTHYTDLDMEQVRKEAYDKGYQDATVKISSDEQAIAEKAYQRGLNDAWEAARKIACDRPHGGFRIDTKQHIFGASDYAYILANYNASEAIDGIKAYEQEQQIAIGDEVVFYNGEKCVVTVVGDGQVAEVMDKGGFSMRMDDGLRNSMKKTGRHFPEIVEVLKKMKEETA